MNLLVVFVARLLLGAVFLTSGLPKLLGPRRTVSDVQRYRILPAPLTIAFGWAIGPVELLSGLALITGYGAREGALVALALLSCFMTVVAIAMARKQNLECNCFGLLYREQVGWATQFRDAILWLLAVIVVTWGPMVPDAFTLATGGSWIGVSGAVATLVFVILALTLGWVASKGWPGWMRRGHRMRSVVPEP